MTQRERVAVWIALSTILVSVCLALVGVALVAGIAGAVGLLVAFVWWARSYVNRTRRMQQ